ncbi:hypothetical protein [Dictyobacter formicarum]|uniref:Uncharacterized protein n=1 Tax=Dictyobacter formicarum TaxID=2778368 RepID=A0ABQ3VR62_9CHLR|nr:hypothetical protein [Dictyobacter formicarum]GHO88318.1 hypothetical protein KSZ_63240 [Dictyobacter formicarum]
MQCHCECCGAECEEVYPVLDLDDPNLLLKIYICVECSDWILSDDLSLLYAA